MIQTDKTKPTLLLASQSPRRRELLALAGLSFEVSPSQCEEDIDDAVPVADRARVLAVRKASDVSAGQPGAVVIGADTLVACDDLVMGKPRDREQAIRMLQQLSGRTHQVYTGVAFASGGRIRSFTAVTDVTFCALTQEEILAYVDDSAASWRDKAGGYGIQEPFGVRNIEKIRGDYYNVMGLPVSMLLRELERFLNG